MTGGKACWVERDVAHGMLRDLLDGLRLCQRTDFLNLRTVIKRGHRRISMRCWMSVLEHFGDCHGQVTAGVKNWAINSP